MLQSQNLLSIGWQALTSEQSGGLPVLNYLIKSDSSDFVYGETPIENGAVTTYSKIIAQPGNEGSIYRFRIAAQNVLGTGPYSDELQLMATNVPQAPSLELSDRTLTSVTLKFTAPADNGGSQITGYQLWRDEGIQGSPSSMVYDGT